MSELTSTDLVRSLASEVCPACRKPKQYGKTLCNPCYRLLPGPLRPQLYRLCGEGYEEAFVEAMKFLGVFEPTMPEVSHA